jgi:hypothetical protein
MLAAGSSRNWSFLLEHEYIKDQCVSGQGWQFLCQSIALLNSIFAPRMSCSYNHQCWEVGGGNAELHIPSLANNSSSYPLLVICKDQRQTEVDGGVWQNLSKVGSLLGPWRKSISSYTCKGCKLRNSANELYHSLQLECEHGFRRKMASWAYAMWTYDRIYQWIPSCIYGPKRWSQKRCVVHIQTSMHTTPL